MNKTILFPLKQLDHWLEKFETWLLIGILSVMMVVAFTQVILRNFFSTALSWGDGLTRALVLWAGFLGASLAVKEGRYINIDAISRVLDEKTKRLARVLIYLFSAFVCFLMGRASVTFVQMEKEAGSMNSMGIANWILQLVIPWVFYLLVFRFLLKMAGTLMGEPLEKQEWER